MNAQVIAALIGACVATVGWVVTYLLKQWADVKEQKKVFLQSQLEEFYAPLLALVQQKLYLQQVQDARMAKTPGGENWVKTLRFFQDNFTIPVMQSIAQLLRTKSYLAVDWPASFDEFLEHEAKSVALYQFWRTTEIPGDVEIIPWPKSLEGDVKAQKSHLEERFRRLYE